MRAVLTSKKPRWIEPRIIQPQLVPDPAMTDAEYFHQRQTNKGEHVGKVGVAMNMLEKIGGLARFSDEEKTEPRIAAAAKFRSLYERAQLGGARATDYAAVRVDTSGQSPNANADFGEDARREYRFASQHLGMVSSSIVERVVIYDQSISAIAGGGSRARARATRQLMDGLDALAVHFKLAALPTQSRDGGR
ncbi:DUF6456 domain-containing protein [Devosia sp.]|uniref:DUF6456 domain-containing protein n=1 Tax=Devosia sp. TaxID=1871048 RepID=UPI001B264234|nr:DUF6456 domain-containing protein [Devosia sp.]MBO9589080.1 hypothetical protein [Devosia sp.]